MDYKEMYGNLITEALFGKFDVIAHGCNCQDLQGAGIAKQMKKPFLQINTIKKILILKEILISLELLIMLTLILKERILKFIQLPY